MKLNKPKIVREAPFNRSVIEHSMERRKIHKNDIQRLEAKIKQLDKEIYETEKIRNDVHRSNSISTHETEMSEEYSYLLTPVPERKSMPVQGIRNTLGHIKGLISHMVELVNRDPNADSNLSSELSKLVKFKSVLASEKDTPEVIKSIKCIIDKTPSILQSMNTQNDSKRQKSK
jgi:hypothetical protein